jgi:small subunit ribosomal protein S8
MSCSDPIADMLTKIRNATMAKFEKVDITTNKIILEIIKILKNEGYVKTFKKIKQDKNTCIRILLKYDEKENCIIHGIKRLSKPGRRIYCGYKDMPRVYNGFGTLIVSTSVGVTTGKKAAEKKVGGELICSIW